MRAACHGRIAAARRASSWIPADYKRTVSAAPRPCRTSTSWKRHKVSILTHGLFVADLKTRFLPRMARSSRSVGLIPVVRGLATELADDRFGHHRFARVDITVKTHSIIQIQNDCEFDSPLRRPLGGANKDDEGCWWMLARVQRFAGVRFHTTVLSYANSISHR